MNLEEHLEKNYLISLLGPICVMSFIIIVKNEILSFDVGSSAILLMWNLSAAFDTIDHNILVSRLCNFYSITGNALDWFRSYLTGRIQRVVIEDSVLVDQELDLVLCWVREFIACTLNLLVISFSGMDCLTIPVQMTHSCI